MMPEILINKDNLQIAITGLSAIKENSHYVDMNMEDLIMISDCKTKDSLTNTFNMLKEIEKSLNELISATILTMGATIEEFTEAEKESIKLYLAIQTGKLKNE